MPLGGQFVGEGLALLSRDGALFFPVAFIANENLVYTFGGMLFDI